MNGKAFTLAAAAGTLFIAGSAAADFVGATISTVATGAGGGANLTVYQVELIFDNPADTINSVGGALGMEMLLFNTDDPAGLYNSAGMTNVDFYNAFAGSNDSYFTLDLSGSAAATPNLFASIGGSVSGTSFSAADDGYFVAGGINIGAANTVVAQFTVGDGFGIGFSGLVGWTGAGTGGLTPFSVNNKDEVPAPGALALLGLAGLAGSRRRRR